MAALVMAILGFRLIATGPQEAAGQARLVLDRLTRHHAGALQAVKHSSGGHDECGL